MSELHNILTFIQQYLIMCLNGWILLWDEILDKNKRWQLLPVVHQISMGNPISIEVLTNVYLQFSDVGHNKSSPLISLQPCDPTFLTYSP